MNFKRYISIYVLLACLSFFTFTSCIGKETGHWPLPEQELSDLDKAIADASEYKERIDDHVDSIRDLLHSPSIPDRKRIDICQEISRFYRTRQADSALNYARMALDLSKKSGIEQEITRSNLLEADALSASGLFSTSIMKYDSVSIENASPDLKLDFWRTGRHIYSNICNYLGEEKDPSFPEYHNKLIVCDDSLIRILPPSSLARKFLISEKLVTEGKDADAQRHLDDLLKSCHKGDSLYGMTCFQLALTFRRTNMTKYAAYLALAAESDIMGAICDGYAMPMLSVWMYDEKKFDRAFNYINFALTEAYNGNARMRLVNISRWVPNIDEAYRHELNEAKNEFVTLSIIVSLFLIGLIVALVYMTREIKKRRKHQSKMAQTSKLKDRYIRDFIRLCSVYSEKYESLNKTVIRKLTAGQSQDLLKLVKYGKTSETENEEFYRTIDSVFFTIYPDFVEKINKLLKPEERFEIAPDCKTLNPELRIYGFVRLGVTESAKIARILNYSANTVYAYRNRMRKRAINHEQFDNDVISIDLEDNIDLD